jgi:Ca2+-binding RTX toxin-like protein
LFVRAVDGGVADASPDTRHFTVDATPPDTTITAGPTAATTERRPTFAFVSSEIGSTFECKLDSAAFASCTSPTTAAGLGDGSHAFSVRATDAVGNTDSTPAMRSFTVTTPPSRPTRLCFDLTPTIVAAPGRTTHGTPGKDVIVGSNAAETIDGGGGDDTICAGGGDDTVRGGAGNDRLSGAAGDDLLLGGSGRDVLLGGSGADRTGGGAGNDDVYGGGGADTLDEMRLGGGGRDRLFGGSGVDLVRTADNTADHVDCGTDRDTAIIDTPADHQTGCERVRRVRR